MITIQAIFEICQYFPYDFSAIYSWYHLKSIEKWLNPFDPGLFFWFYFSSTKINKCTPTFIPESRVVQNNFGNKIPVFRIDSSYHVDQFLVHCSRWRGSWFTSLKKQCRSIMSHFYQLACQICKLEMAFEKDGIHYRPIDTP